MPDDLTKAIIVPISKGSRKVYEKHRGISLTNNIQKIPYILLNKLSPYAEEYNTEEYQRGFRRGRTTADKIYNSR